MPPTRATRRLYWIVAHTAILLLLTEGAMRVAIIAGHRTAPQMQYEQLPEWTRRNYSHMTPAEVDALLRATRALRFRYVPAGAFVREAATSRFVNVDEHGVRANGGKRRDITAMQDAVWILGGSTMFGSGVADHETIPAQLEQLLVRPVINLGAWGDGSRVENRLLNSFLRMGYRPAMAIFLDGIDEACEPDAFGGELEDQVTNSQDAYEWRVPWLLGQVSARLHRRNTPARATLTCSADGATNSLGSIHARRLTERTSICRLYGVPCRTFVQPVAGLHGRHDDRAFVAGPRAAHLRALFEHLENNWRSHGATLVTGALDGSDRHAFIDDVHYSADASRLIAGAIAAHLQSPTTAVR